MAGSCRDFKNSGLCTNTSALHDLLVARDLSSTVLMAEVAKNGMDIYVICRPSLGKI